ncbi:MAG: MlaD family protein [Cytophagaceae bacterium]
MALSKEVKVGLLALVAGVVLYVGFNFLKGVDFFSPTKKYYVVYKEVDGLTVSNPVTLHGLAVGRVSRMELLTTRDNLILVELQVDEELQIGDSTLAFISNTDLLGGKSVDLRIGRNSRVFESGDTLIGMKEKSLTDRLGEKALPIMANLDSTVIKMNKIFGDELGTSISNTLHNFELASHNLKSIMETNKTNIATITGNLAALSVSLKETERELKPLLAKMNSVADSLNDMKLKETVSNANAAMANLNKITDKINQGQGSLGALVNDKAFINNLNTAISNMNKLVVDLKYNPRHYFAPLGKKPGKNDEKPAE